MTSNLLPLFAVAAPFLAWPVELLLPYPYLVEELLKAALVYWGRPRLHTALLSGTLFAFSEAVFYLFNSPLAFSRLAFTIPLHAGTFALLAFSRRRLFPLGLLTAILIHWVYNYYLQPM